MFLELLGEDNFDDDVDEVRDGLVELYLSIYLPLCTSLKKSFSTLLLYSSVAHSLKSSLLYPACLRHSL